MFDKLYLGYLYTGQSSTSAKISVHLPISESAVATWARHHNAIIGGVGMFAVTNTNKLVLFTFLSTILFTGFINNFLMTMTSSMTFSYCLYFRGRDSEYLAVAMFGRAAVLSLYLGNILLTSSFKAPSPLSSSKQALYRYLPRYHQHHPSPPKPNFS